MNDRALRLIQDDLTQGFLHIESERLRPSFLYDRTAAVNLYMNDPLLHSRVDSIVGHVMDVVCKHLGDQGTERVRQ